MVVYGVWELVLVAWWVGCTGAVVACLNREATRLTGVITSIERTVLEYDAELSFTGTLGVFQ